MAQNWHDLLFANCRFPAHVMRKLLPETQELDLMVGRRGSASCRFTMSGVRLRGDAGSAVAFFI